MKYEYYAVFFKNRDNDDWNYAFNEVGGVGVCNDLDDARKMAKEAVVFEIEYLLEKKREIPAPTSREIIEEEMRNDPENDGLEWFVELVEAEVSIDEDLKGASERDE